MRLLTKVFDDHKRIMGLVPNMVWFRTITRRKPFPIDLKRKHIALIGCTVILWMYRYNQKASSVIAGRFMPDCFGNDVNSAQE